MCHSIFHRHLERQPTPRTSRCAQNATSASADRRRAPPAHPCAPNQPYSPGFLARPLRSLTPQRGAMLSPTSALLCSHCCTAPPPRCRECQSGTRPSGLTRPWTRAQLRVAMLWPALLAAMLAILAPAAVSAGADASTSPIKCSLIVNGSEPLPTLAAWLIQRCRERSAARRS